MKGALCTSVALTEKKSIACKLGIIFYLVTLVRTVAGMAASQTAPRNCSIWKEPGYIGVLTQNKTCSQTSKDYC